MAMGNSVEGMHLLGREMPWAGGKPELRSRLYQCLPVGPEAQSPASRHSWRTLWACGPQTQTWPFPCTTTPRSAGSSPALSRRSEGRCLAAPGHLQQCLSFRGLHLPQDHLCGSNLHGGPATSTPPSHPPRGSSGFPAAAHLRGLIIHVGFSITCGSNCLVTTPLCRCPVPGYP